VTFLYTHMKQDLKGRHFVDVPAVQRELLAAGWPLTAFLLKILDGVSSSESSAGIVVSSHGGGGGVYF
jgi:hypothetical protein